MNILVCVSQVPFVRGGAESLVDGLLAALQRAGHQTEAVALPFKWYPKERLLTSALAWRLLDLTESNGQPVDLVICTKYPTWAVRHPRKVAWVVHQHRQVYDWFGGPLSDFTNCEEDRAIRRRIIEIDRRGLGECERRFAISRNVAARLERWTGLTAEPLYVPVSLAGLQTEAYGDFILSLSRLDAAKRVDLLIRALVQVEGVRAVIAGTGPEQDALHALAGKLGVRGRVEFAGRVSDEEAARLYNTARAIFYGPVDEDYGLATIEAFHAGKPVLTCSDSGGVLEFVLDGRTGFVTPPGSVDQLAARIRQLMDDPELARRLGEHGRETIAGIEWESVVRSLVG